MVCFNRCSLKKTDTDKAACGTPSCCAMSKGTAVGVGISLGIAILGLAAISIPLGLKYSGRKISPFIVYPFVVAGSIATTIAVIDIIAGRAIGDWINHHCRKGSQALYGDE